MAFAEKSGVLCAAEVAGLASADTAWFAPFQGPVCAGKARKACASSFHRTMVPPNMAARSESLLMSPPISTPASSRPQGWKTYGTAVPLAEIGFVWNNVRTFE